MVSSQSVMVLFYCTALFCAVEAFAWGTALRPHQELTSLRLRLSTRSQLRPPLQSSTSIVAGCYDPPPYLQEMLINDRRRGGEDAITITAAELAVQSGRTVEQSASDLLKFAYAVGARMRVSKTGDISYSIPPSYEDILRKRYFLVRMRPCMEVAQKLMYTSLKVGVGLTMVISTMLFTSILFSAASSSKREEDRDSSGQHARGRSSKRHVEGRRGPSLHLVLDLGDVFRLLLGRKRNVRRGGAELRMSFLESCFSYVFGDGDLNEAPIGYQSRRLGLGARTIQLKGGIVAAEELLPFVDQPPPLPQSAGVRDADFAAERAVLPVVLHYRGSPIVTEGGSILYEFPDLSSASRTGDSHSGGAQLPLLERQVPFSRAEPLQLAAAATLGVVNLVAAVLVHTMVPSGWLAARFPPFFVRKVLPFLKAYAVLYSAIPAVRFWWLRRINYQICRRNQLRSGWSHLAATDPVAIAKQRERNALLTDRAGGRSASEGDEGDMGQAEEWFVYDTEEPALSEEPR